MSLLLSFLLLFFRLPLALEQIHPNEAIQRTTGRPYFPWEGQIPEPNGPGGKMASDVFHPERQEDWIPEQPFRKRLVRNRHDHKRTTIEDEDPAVYRLNWNRFNSSIQLEYTDLKPELLDDQLRSMGIYDELESSPSANSFLKRRLERSAWISRALESDNDDKDAGSDSGNGDGDDGGEKSLSSFQRPSEFNEYFKVYKHQRNAIENDPEAVEMKKYFKKIKKRSKENGKNYKRKKRFPTVQSLHEMNQFLMSSLQTVRSWLVYEENGRAPEVRMSHEKLLKAFEIYYECLEREFQHHRENLGQPMNDVQTFNAMSNERVVIECKTCIPPFISGRDYGLVWYRRLLKEEGAYQALPEDENLFSMSADGDLTMHMLRPPDAGMYTCFKGDAQEATYLIGIDDSESRIRVFEDTNSLLQATQPIILAQFNLYVFYQWSTWSDCNRCNGKGARKRIGTCMVKKFDKKRPIRPKDSAILRRYSNGLPCISPLIPHFIYKDAQLSKRRTELMIAACFNTCITKPPIKVITDENGKKLDVVKIFKGRHSFYDGVPQLGTPIERITKHATLDRKVTIACPHVNASKMSVRWQNGTVMLEESKMGYTTNFRVKINARNEIVIRKALKFDENYYSCWHNLQHLGTVRLYVVENLDWRYYWDTSLRQVGFFICCVSFGYLVLRLIFLRCRVPQQFR